jgi:hypothetical protein
MNIKLEAQQKKLKPVRGSYTDLDLSIHAKKGPEKSLNTLPLSNFFYQSPELLCRDDTHSRMIRISARFGRTKACFVIIM